MIVGELAKLNVLPNLSLTVTSFLSGFSRCIPGRLYRHLRRDGTENWIRDNTWRENIIYKEQHSKNQIDLRILVLWLTVHHIFLTLVLVNTLFINLQIPAMFNNICKYVFRLWISGWELMFSIRYCISF